MREQREGLPIFKLRSQLLQAMAENQVRVVRCLGFQIGM